MKIAIINLTGGGMSGGYRKYLRNILPRIAAHPEVDAILCAYSASLNVKDWFESLHNVKFVNCKTYRLFGYFTDSELHYQLKDFCPDVVFVPTERFFRFSGVPIVNMIQNMEPFVAGIDGNSFSERFRLWVQCMDAKKTIEKSDHVIALSEFVRDFLIQQWGVPDNKIGLVYLGIDSPENEDVKRPPIISEGWKDKFLFTAGSVRPARGLEDVLYALNSLKDKSSNISGLVIAGETTSEMRTYKKRLESWIQKRNLSSKVCWAGSLNKKEMAWCYQHCAIFIMTSRVEACPNIALEAMSHGCLSIASKNPPLPEIFSDTASYYPPKDYKALAEIIQTVLSWDNNQRSEVSERARKRSTQFSWDVTAERTVSELVKAIESFR